jgi:hypothetical protein
MQKWGSGFRLVPYQLPGAIGIIGEDILLILLSAFSLLPSEVSMSSDSQNYGPRQRRSMPMAARLVPILMGLVAIGWIAIKGCQQGPFGRQQIVGLNVQEEDALGLQAFQETLSDARVVRGGMEVAEVKEVANRLIAATKHPDFLASIELQPRDMQ